MGVIVECDICNEDIPQIADIICKSCLRQPCATCKETADEVYCEKCAKEEFTTPEPDVDDLISSVVREDWIEDLAHAVRQGNRDDAEYLLDQIAANVTGWDELVSRGRFKPARRSAA